MGLEGLHPPPPPTPRIVQILNFGPKSNIRAKPLDIRGSNGENIRARDFSPPPPNETRPARIWV